MRTTPTPVRATRPRRTASSRWPRPTTSSATPRSASSTTRCAPCSPEQAPGGGFGGFPGGFGGQTSGGSGGFDVSDLFGDLFNQGGGRSTGFGNRSRAPRPAKGADVETETSLDFQSAVDGTTISMRLRSDAPCPTCSGTGGKPGTRPHVCGTCDGAGMVVNSVGGGFSMNETCPECHGRQLVYDEPCPTCHGSGRGFSDRTVSARIPAGVKDGQRIRLKGKGAAGENGGPHGDLLVTVHVKPHQLFGRKADNLTLEVPVTFDEAALGAEIKVPTLDGAPVTLRIPPGTPNGRVLRVRGRGAPRKDGSKGDLLVTVVVQVPDTLDDAARAAVTAYREARSRQRSASRPVPGGRVMAGRVARVAAAGFPGPTVPVYVISVAAELTGLHPQTLRQYDRVGLVSPGRTGGGGRRYSLRDIELLREVAELTARGSASKAYAGSSSSSTRSPPCAPATPSCVARWPSCTRRWRRPSPRSRPAGPTSPPSARTGRSPRSTRSADRRELASSAVLRRLSDPRLPPAVSVSDGPSAGEAVLRCCWRSTGSSSTSTAGGTCCPSRSSPVSSAG